MGDVIGDDALGVVKGERHQDADALALDGFVEAFDLAVRLRIIGRSSHMGHAHDADELFEVLGDELRPVVADDAWARLGKLFAGPQDDGLHVAFLHILADVPVDDEAAIAVEDGAQEIKGAGDVEVADVHMPLLVRLQRLDEAGAFLGDVGRLAGQQAELFQDPIDAGRAAGDDVGIEHHDGHAAISFIVVRAGEVADAHDLVLGEPMIAWQPGVVLVDLAEALTPIFVLAAADADPGHETRDGDVGLVGPGADEIDDRVARVMGDPTFDQASPFLFFSSVRVSMSSAMTSFFFWSLASSLWIFSSLALSTALATRPFSKRVWPFSKSSFCQR